MDLATRLSVFFLSDTMWLIVQGSLIAAFLAGAYLYATKRMGRKGWGIEELVLGVISVRLLYGLVRVIGQYYIWSQSDLAKLFLTAKLPAWFFDGWPGKVFFFLNNPRGYFFYYSFNHFFLNTFITVIMALIWYGFLRLLKRHQERFFEEGEVQLGFLLALIVGWPGFVLFIPLLFISVVVLSLIRAAVFRLPYTTLGYPFLLAVLVIILFGEKLIALFGLDVLRI